MVLTYEIDDFTGKYKNHIFSYNQPRMPIAACIFTLIVPMNSVVLLNSLRPSDA